MVNRQDLVKKANDNGLIYANPQGFGLMDQLSELAKDMAHQKEHNARQNEYNARQNEQIARQNELNARQNEQIARLNEQIARLSEHDAQQEAEIKFLRGQVETLTKINDQSHNIRMRFISKYKRDVLNKATSTDHDAIDAGNIDTHEGNARGDAMLYKLRKRIDEAIYMALYGLGWNLVLNLSKFPLSTILRLLETDSLPSSLADAPYP